MDIKADNSPLSFVPDEDADPPHKDQFIKPSFRPCRSLIGANL
jgi:hypothetical protein